MLGDLSTSYPVDSFTRRSHMIPDISGSNSWRLWPPTQLVLKASWRLSTHVRTLEQLDSVPGEGHHIGDHTKSSSGCPRPRHMDTPTPWNAQKAEDEAGRRQDDEAEAKLTREGPSPDGGDSKEDSTQRYEGASDREEDDERCRPVVEDLVGDIHGCDPGVDQNLDQWEAHG